ncbi:hypothetical protein P5673_009978 [Acropora cervicornis]|uniref:Protein aurora borealis n=1 Tax=Acropora cervicornis TaxID=6130 RepID=A0AAD9QS43_ACRCE|nr:hypothetical protein P5673_009978 [Acropora cervicornis]
MVESVSTLSSFDLTRNPFDSSLEERVNCPGFSLSMFSKQETPASQKNPADIDEYPHQEYSSTFEREEDEIQVQKAIDEYFSQSSIVPSPWTPTYSTKHVKFSPLPPATACCKTKADASSQTKLSLPPNFDLQNHISEYVSTKQCQHSLSKTFQFQGNFRVSNLSIFLDPAYYNQDGLNGSKDMSLSQLRRKLFDQAAVEMEKDNCKLEPPTNIKSILKSPKTNLPDILLPITSSPVSDRSTPISYKHRSSTASTMSSPNMSPIKPMLSVPETPSPQKGLSVSRQTFSPMECSNSGLNTSGINVIGDDLPNISPIKYPKVENSGQQMDITNDTEDVEKNDDNCDDGGPLEVSALSVEENADDKNNAKEEESDNERPPGITMEDLASDLDFTQDDVGDERRDSSNDKFELQSPKENSTDEKPGQHVVDRSNIGNGVQISTEHPKGLKENRIEVDSVGSSHEHIENASNSDGNRQSNLGKEMSWESLDLPSQRAWHTIGYHRAGSRNKYSHISEFDEDIIMIRAKAALRRANHHFSMDRSLSLSDLSLNTSSAWEPYDGKESWYGKSGQEMTPYQHHTATRKTYSPGVDLMRQRKVHQKLEEKYGFSMSRRKPSSSLYQSKRQLSHTYPMSDLELKALYWRPPVLSHPRRGKLWYGTDPREEDLKRLSWPSQPPPSRFVHGARPLSPPVYLPQAKVPRPILWGRVSKMPLVSFQDNSDSGYSDWQQSTGQWENTTRSHHGSLRFLKTGTTYY